MPDKKPKVRFAALCDNVYQDESSRKFVLSGYYTGSIVVDAFPTHLQLALYIEVSLPDTSAHQFDLEFLVDGKVMGGARADATATDPAYPFGMVLPQIQVDLPRPVDLEIRFAVDRGKPSYALKKRVEQRSTLTNASPPPSSQSPTAAQG